MTLYKVAKHIDTRPLSTHNYLHTALFAKVNAGYEYNVYKWDKKQGKWKLFFM